MTSIPAGMAELDFFADLDADAQRLMAGCGRTVHVPEGQYLFHEGGHADAFYAVRDGRVAIEVHDPRSGRIVIDTVDRGDVVGWSWLVPPYRWLFDARAVTGVDAIQFDADELRAACQSDPRFGYALMQRVAHVMHARLQASRVRLLDLYGARR